MCVCVITQSISMNHCCSLTNHRRTSCHGYFYSVEFGPWWHLNSCCARTRVYRLLSLTHSGQSERMRRLSPTMMTPKRQLKKVCNLAPLWLLNTTFCFHTDPLLLSELQRYTRQAAIGVARFGGRNKQPCVPKQTEVARVERQVNG